MYAGSKARGRALKPTQASLQNRCRIVGLHQLGCLEHLNLHNVCDKLQPVFEHWLQGEPQFRPYCLPHYSLEGKHFSTVQAAEDCSRLHPVQALHFVETQLLIAASIT